MEQDSARIPRDRRFPLRRGRTAKPPSPGARAGARGTGPARAVPRRSRPVPAAPGPAAARRTWPPGARLTGLGCGLLATGATAAAGGLDVLLLDGHTTAYGICFVLVSAVCALWVRPADLAAAPIAAPIAFMAGLLFLSGDSDGSAGWLVELVTALAVNAGWVYGGTLAAVLVVLARAGAGRRGPGRSGGPAVGGGRPG
ncbi:hypothetical protein GCM10010420_20400 [Streptomyces glaucosporus]|uniref:DUF6542 domain-containing protein n=1 Tax=Streptomyces glaucosporus TaxID=284044 RepID=A0ABN3I551_9ACTN